MKRAAAYLAALLLCLSANAGGKDFLRRFHPGLEWGYTLTATSYQHFNYLDTSIGFRINDQGWTYPPRSNAFILGSLTFDLSDRFCLGLLSGYEGIDRMRRTIPLLCRGSFYPNGRDEDGVFFFSDLGLNLSHPEARGNQMQIGSGYTIFLAPRCALAFQAGGRVTYDRPDVWDPIEEEYIPKRNIKRNDAWYFALNIGVSLKF
ncbi:MAG: hypothetical protein IKZ60_04175 [Bacteroidales bacterium]|nr:hypothetical protein [Bacteroidales bacterium]